jgi:hypothetical protein
MFARYDTPLCCEPPNQTSRHTLTCCNSPPLGSAYPVLCPRIELAQVVSLLTCMQEVPGSNLVPGHRLIWDETSSCVYESLLQNSAIRSEVRPRLLSATHHPIQCSVIIPPFDTVWGRHKERDH